MVGWLTIAVFCQSAIAAAPPTENDYYRLLTLPTPGAVPFEVSGMDVLNDGRLAAAIRKGEVWILDNPYADPPKNLQYKRIADALHEPLGLMQRDDSLYLTQRTELTRLRDTNADDFIDEYLTVSNAWGVTGNYHEYAYGPKLDPNGDFWVTLNITLGPKPIPNDAWRGWGLKIKPNGDMTPICAGMRSPCGIGRNAQGDMFFTDQQGNWVATNTLHHMRPGAFFGHVDSLQSCNLPGSPIKHPGKVPSGIPIPEAKKKLPILSLPAVWFPYKKMGQSATDVICNQTAGQFGPFADQLFVGDFTLAKIHRVFLEKVDGQYQGACFPFRQGLQSAVIRMAWGQDGSMFIGQTNRGWNSIGNRSYGLQRLVWTGKTPFEIQEMRARPDGFELTFTQPIDEQSANGPDAFRMSSYTYTYQQAYGSPEIDTKNLSVQVAQISPDARRVYLTVTGLREMYVHELHAPGIRSATSAPLLHPEAYYTLNKIPTRSP
jgi:hypothetical protein